MDIIHPPGGPRSAFDAGADPFDAMTTHEMFVHKGGLEEEGDAAMVAEEEAMVELAEETQRATGLTFGGDFGTKRKKGVEKTMGGRSLALDPDTGEYVSIDDVLNAVDKKRGRRVGVHKRDPKDDREEWDDPEDERPKLIWEEEKDEGDDEEGEDEEAEGSSAVAPFKPTRIKDRKALQAAVRHVLDPLEKRITELVRSRYPELCGRGPEFECTPCGSVIRRYLPDERRSRVVHREGQALIAVVTTLNDHHNECVWRGCVCCVLCVVLNGVLGLLQLLCVDGDLIRYCSIYISPPPRAFLPPSPPPPPPSPSLSQRRLHGHPWRGPALRWFVSR